MFWLILGHCLLYAPTVALTNSLAFHHLRNGEKDFGAVRLWGTIGWIAIGWAFGSWLDWPCRPGRRRSPPVCRTRPTSATA